ncbi:ionotropic receptor 21a-like [Palaemon carinicauda]|uniref:ionotropic receptor 21a-like n=1 Tax=Palaemon carinicauda TaxID=392227 RepID=UPI0035B609B4
MLKGGSYDKLVILWLFIFVIEVGGQVVEKRETNNFPNFMTAETGSDKHSNGKGLSSDEEGKILLQDTLAINSDYSWTGHQENSGQKVFNDTLLVGISELRKSDRLTISHVRKCLSLHEQRETEYKDPSTAAVKSILDSLHLLKKRCSLTIFSDEGARETAGRMERVLRDRPLKIYELKKDILERKSTWARTLCDCYMFFLKEFVNFKSHASVSHYHKSIHDPNPLPLWNYHAYHLVILPNHHNMSMGPLDILSLYNFQKTVRVVVLQPKDDHVLTWSHQLYKPGSGLRYLGSWEKGIFHERHQQFFKTDEENFEGAPLRVATFDHPPSVVYEHDEDHNIISRLGVDMQIVKRLAQAMNFTPEYLEIPYKELWGYELPNGTWTGLVGKVFYEQADIGACNVFLELHRWKMVDYSVPYNFERGCFVAPSPKPLLNWKSPVMPFAWDTWTFIAVSLLTGGFLLYLVATLSINRESREFLSFSYDYLYIMAALTMRSSFIVPSHTPLRIYIGFAGIFCLILSTAYSANLVAFLSVTQMSAPIDTMKDLSASGLRIGGVAFWKTQFTASIDPVVQKFANVLESNVDLSSLFDRVEAGEFALIENKQYLEVQAGARYTYGSRTTIRIVGECLLPYSIGLAFQKNSPLKQVFDGVILRLFESGVVIKWQKEVVDYFRLQYKEKRQQQKAGEGEISRGSKPLNLEQLQGVFYVLGLGYLLSALILLAEIVPTFL